MRKLFLIIPLIVLSIYSYGNNVKVNVGFNFKPKNDSIAIAVFYHNGSFSPDRLNLDTLIKIKPGDFELKLQTGTYVFRFFHPEITTIDVPLVIERLESNIGFDILLEESWLPSEIKNVQLIIRTKKRETKILDLFNSENKWTAPQESLPNDINTYVFRVNNSQYFHRLDYPAVFQRAFFYYENEFQGEDIYFSEDEYLQKEPSITFYSKEIDLDHFYNVFKKINAVFEDSYIGMLSLGNTINVEYFNETSSIFNQILEQENSYYNQLVIEPYIRLINIHHPVNQELRLLSQKKLLNEINKLRLTEAYKEMEQNKLYLLKAIDPKSLFLSGSFLDAFRNLDFGPHKYIEYDLPFGFFLQMEHDFKQQSPSYFAKGRMLQRDISNLRRENPDKALHLINILEKEYPRYPPVRWGNFEKLKTELLLQQRLKAPNFELVALNGDTIRLSDFKGKYIFLDFWGTWCAPCIVELPYIKELSENISNDKLIVIGVACNDTKERVEKTIQSRNLQYLNALANKEIIADYGISSFPTNYLIDPDGIIIGNNFRGSDLSERIKRIINL